MEIYRLDRSIVIGWLLVAALVGPPVATTGAARLDEAPPITPFATARVQIEGTISAQGQEAPVQGEGDIDAARGASRLTVALLGAAFETVVVDGRTYTRNALNGRWEYSDGAAGGFNPVRLAPYDPATIRAAGRNFTRLGAELVGGVPTTHWRADADLTRLIGLTPGATGGLGANTTTMDLFIGDTDGRLRRLVIDSQGTTGNPGGPENPFRLALTLTFSNFDAPVAIVAPPGAVPAATPGATPGAALGGLPLARATATSGAAAAVRTPTRTPLQPVSTGVDSQGQILLRILSLVSLGMLVFVGVLAAYHRRARRIPQQQEE